MTDGGEKHANIHTVEEGIYWMTLRKREDSGNCMRKPGDYDLRRGVHKFCKKYGTPPKF
jgi:hypothetical protein